MEHEQMNVTFDRLMLDPANARKKYDHDSIKSMKASILAKGIIQPLAVRPPQEGDADLGGQMFKVFAGGRRMRAMAQLIEEKAISADFQIPIIVRNVDDAQAAEMSLAENIIRHAMEPVDEFRAFKELEDKGFSAEEIALRFGQSLRFVKGRLALGALHPTILEAFANGEIKWESACAYTVNPDQGAQLAFFEAAAGSWTQDNSQHIKQAMRAEGLRSNSNLAAFIREERYIEAGGVINEDLFGEDRFWMSADIIVTLKASRIAELREQALLDGWSFFETIEEFGGEMYQVKAIAPEPVARSKKDAKRMDKISEEIEAMPPYWQMTAEAKAEHDALNAEYEALEEKMSAFTTAQKAASGVVFNPETLESKLGAIKGKPSKVPGSGAAADDSNDDNGTDAPAKPAKDPLALTQPLKDMIGETATTALRAEVIAKPHLALALLAAMLEQSDNTTMGTGRPSRIKVERINYVAGEKKAKERSIHAAYAAYAKMKPAALAKALAEVFAPTVDLTETWFYKDFTGDERREKTRSEFLNAFGANPLAHFDPGKFFASNTKPMIDAACKEMTGFSATRPKKSDMADEAAEHAKAAGWLPGPLRLKGYKIKKV